MVDIAFRSRAGSQDVAVRPGQDVAVRPGRTIGRLLLDRRLGTSGAVLAIVAFLAMSVGVFVLVLYAASLAF